VPLCAFFQVELDAAADVQSLQRQLQAHFRSQNVFYALLVEGGCFTLGLLPWTV
jgi:hypothetical protein